MNLLRSASIWGLTLALTMTPHMTAAQVISDQPVVFSQTVIAIVPGSTVPRAITQSPDLQTPLLKDEADNQPSAEENPVEDNVSEEESATADIRAQLARPAPSRMTLRVQVRGEQVPVHHGIFHNYKLDTEHGVLTYFADSAPRTLIAENIQVPLDILFIQENGIIAQIVPQVTPAFIPDDIRADFPLRALLYIQAGLAELWGIQPGYRVEHGMFTPSPLIYTAPAEIIK